MTDREKLIEAANELNAYRNRHYNDSSATDEYKLAQAINDVLPMLANIIANNVTVQEWIPVTERLPKESATNFKWYIVKVCRSYYPTGFDFIDSPYDEEYTTPAMYDCNQKVWHLANDNVVLNALIMPEDAPLNGEVVIEWMPLPDSQS